MVSEISCFKFNDFKLKVTAIYPEVGVYETKVIGQRMSFSRNPASISENLDKMLSNLEQYKIKHCWKNVYFHKQDLAEKTEYK